MSVKRTEPTLPVTDRRFVYTPASNTDIRERFKRIRAEQQKPADSPNVKPIAQRRSRG